MKEPKVSIVIVNYNGKILVDALLKSISKLSYKNYETIVVDNSSTDGSREFVRKNYKKTKLVENKINLGYSGINSALKFCSGEYLLFLNNDMELDKNSLNELAKALNSDRDTAMAAPGLVNFYDKKLKSGGTWLSRAFYNGHAIGNDKDREKEIPYMGVGLIRKDFVDMFGYLFDPDYFIYGEDVDLGLRIRLCGKKTLFEPKSIMYHMHSVTMQKQSGSFSAYLMERNLLITFFKNLELKNIILLLPYVKLMRFIAIIRDILSLRPDLALARLKALFWVLFNLNKILKKRKETQKFRKADDNYVLKIFSEKYLFREKFIV
ncbi:glycosyltransferase family 2 protein [Candidatus Woesearchaeota archaeon]|nr:glycosyltransferase family 2 protein [Candidatus Woesearchaeota archaeon]